MRLKFSQNEVQKNTFEVCIPSTEIKVDKKKIGEFIGYQNDYLPDHIEELIDEIISQMIGKLNVKAGFHLDDFSYSSQMPFGITIGRVYLKTEKIIASQIKKSEKAAVFLCTIGPLMELWVKQIALEAYPVKSYLADIIASTAVENAANLLHHHIKLEMKNLSLNCTNRYSPGYCNWSVQEQQKLFSFFPKNFCGVQLTDSSLMIPIKSISGIIGIGSGVKYTEYICDKCGVKDCSHRIYLLTKQKQKKSLGKKYD